MIVYCVHAQAGTMGTERNWTGTIYSVETLSGRARNRISRPSRLRMAEGATPSTVLNTREK